MAQGGTLKLSINLNRGVSSTSENSQQIATDQGDQTGENDGSRSQSQSRPSSNESSSSNTGSGEGNSRSASRNNLLNVKIPTATKNARKRKHIQTNFDDAKLLNKRALDAQQKEKERLLRLERLKSSVDQNDHISQMAALMPANRSAQSPSPLPVLDLDDIDSFEYDSKKWRQDDSVNGFGATYPSTSGVEKEEKKPKQVHEVIDLSSDDEDDIKEIGSFTPRRVEPPLPVRRNRWYGSDKDRLVREKMDEQHRIEQKRLSKRKNLGDIEKVEITGGRLIVNRGHPPEDPDIAVTAHLTHVLQPHQLGGIRFMYDNIVESIQEYKTSNGFGCILAHSMGLGKTIQVVTFTDIFFRATRAHKVLVIVPVNTIQNWLNEYEKWLPKYSSTGDRLRTFEVFILGDGVKTFDQRVSLIEEWATKGGVLLIGYDMFRLLIRNTQPKKAPRTKLNFVNGNKISRDEQPDDFDQGFTHGGRVRKEANQVIRQALLDPGPDLVACDEGHKIKNLNTDISIALGSIRTTRRIVLTGYPLQNNLMEYYCMVDFVRPKYLGEKKSFSIMFEKPIKNGLCVDSTPGDIKLAMQRTHVLVEMLKGFVQRRTHHLLKSILPKSKEYVLLLRKSPLQHALYRNFLIYANMEIKTGTGNVFNPLKAFAACSKIWNHPDVLSRTLARRRAEREKANAKKNNGARAIEPAASSFSNQTASSGSNGAMTLSSILNDPTTTQAVNHRQLWSGLFGGAAGAQACDLDIADVDDDVTCSGDKRGRGQKKKKDITSALADELDMADQGLKYDWADLIMAHHQLGNIEHGYKMKLAMEIIDETTKIGEKILLFSQNLTALDLIEQYLDNRKVVHNDTNSADYWLKNRNYFRLDGSTNGADREKLITRFNSDPNIHLFLISTRAGSLGINLVSANRCIILDACWNPCHDAQAVCRVYRYGQQRRTYIYRLIMDNCMEKAIFNRQISKHGLQQRVVDDARVEANVTQKELETLLMYDEAQDVVTGDGSWDTSAWDLDDPLLERVVARNSKMISQEPFLHESLILEREEGLSEQEKMEAQLLFERERAAETAGVSSFDSFERGMANPLAGVTRDPRMPSGIPNWAALNNMTAQGFLDAPPPLRATPIPHQLQMMPSQAGYNSGRSVLGGSSGIGTGNGIGQGAGMAHSQLFGTPNGVASAYGMPNGSPIGANRQNQNMAMTHNNAPQSIQNMNGMPTTPQNVVHGGGLTMAGAGGSGGYFRGGSHSGRTPPFGGAGQATGYNQNGRYRMQPNDYAQFNNMHLNDMQMNGMQMAPPDYQQQQQQIGQQQQLGQQQQAYVHTFSDGQVSVPGLSYAGAKYAAECKTNISGTMQRILTDRELSLPNLALPTQVQPVGTGTEVTVVRTGAGVYLRLLNGIILDATGSIYDIGAAFPVSNVTPPSQQQQQQQMTSSAASMPQMTVKRESVKPEVIDLD